MTDSEARTLLDKKLESRSESDDERVRLASSLECIPLALTQAAAYINRRKRMTIRRYIEILENDRNKTVALLYNEEADLRRSEDMPKSVLRTWQITFDHIQSHHKTAANLLSRASFFDAKSIPEMLLQAIAIGEEKLREGSLEQKNLDEESLDEERLDEERHEEAIDTLLRYALLGREASKTSFKMHALVQLAAITWMKLLEILDQHKERALEALSEIYPTGKVENWATCSILEPRAQSLLKFQCNSELTKLLRAEIQYLRA